MNPHFSRTKAFFSSRSFIINPINRKELRLSAFACQFHSSPSPSYLSRRHEEESRAVRVSVWWDFENCTLPAGANAFRVAQSIAAAIRANGIKGPIQITAFGDVLQLSRSNQEALSATGINLTHIPNGGKNSADRSLLIDLMYWVSQNPPPAHLFLISGDRDFAGILHRLRMSNYNILLASPETAPSVLCCAASIMWHWNTLVKGENLTGKHFNQPPDGPYGSWYAHYRAPLKDPFAVTEQLASSRTEEVSDSNSDPKPRTVPKAVVKQIRRILKSYPEGISLGDLRLELKKCNLSIDKDLYGFKKFSHFLLSMPHILNLCTVGDGQLLIRLVASKVSEPVKTTTGVASGANTNNAESDSVITSKVNGVGSPSSTDVDENASPPKMEINAKESSRKLQEPQVKLAEPPPLSEKVNNAKKTEKHLHLIEDCSSTCDEGFFTRMWRKWFAEKDGVPEKISTSSSESDVSTKAEVARPTSQNTDPADPASLSPSNSKTTMNKVDRDDEPYGDKSSRHTGFWKQIRSWCVFWRKSNFENSREQSVDKLNHVPIDCGKDGLFLQESFWKEMEAFINTPPNGSILVLQSRSREQLAQNLQQQGPSVIRCLGQDDLLNLVDLLISDKKWVTECPSEKYPFKLILPAGKSSSSTPTNSNGLRSLFLSKSECSSNRLLEYDEEKRHQNLPRTGVCLPVINKKASGKSRNEMLADCHKLVDDILKEYPEGFNMASFRKMFLERNGYPLDIQKLGYQKLVTLLQIMPGVKVESTIIYPSSSLETALPSAENNTNISTLNLDDEISDGSKKGDDPDCPWEELGPVASTAPQQNEIDLGSKRSANEETVKQRNHDYEALADDYITDSEEEDSSLVGSDETGKPGINEGDSPLLKILDSWYRTKEEINRKEGRDNVDGKKSLSLINQDFLASM
ncbi:uncharacterized protein LOC127799512 isoform X2 [Diospyros lotus]|uniref:uncharacterized protein LOC127799512 isoform X2 n=1 Tax=Diospyros lotus TaxID=55363 RepID=UPI002253256E|nr:uncharacterized protein LOC127799512 isoform X2 [Diospyros lotus]